LGKYDPLHRFLASPTPGVSEITLSLSQLEQLLGDELPYTGKHSSHWWACEVRSGIRPQSSSWLKAGWHVGAVEPKQAWVRLMEETDQAIEEHGV